MLNQIIMTWSMTGKQDLWNRVLGHPDFAKYIESFNSKPIPGTYEVCYDNGGEAVSANFMRVGDWAASRFGANEGSLSRGGLAKSPGMPPIVSRNPQDCFDRVAMSACAFVSLELTARNQAIALTPGLAGFGFRPDHGLLRSDSLG